MIRVQDWNWLVLASASPLQAKRVGDLHRLPVAWRKVLAEARSVPPLPSVRVLTDDWAPLELLTDAMYLSEK
jgi:hypothetical protein